MGSHKLIATEKQLKQVMFYIERRYRALFEMYGVPHKDPDLFAEEMHFQLSMLCNELTDELNTLQKMI